jgi:branched-chain amino acid transport system permease protein
MTAAISKFGGWVALSILGLAVVIAGDPYWLSLGFNVLIFAVLAVGMNVVVGYAGLLDLGYAAFFAIGAYTTALLLTYTGISFWFAWPISGITAGIFGIIVGAPTLRLRTDYLAIVTLGFGEITRIVITNLEITGGPSGLYNLSPPSFLGHPIESQATYYLLAVLMLGAGMGFCHWVRRTRLGAAWIYVRHDEEVAQAVGVNPLLAKIAAYGFGAVWGGLAGALFVESETAVSPTSFTFVQSLLVVMAVILGGQGSLMGVMLGTLLVVAVPELFRATQSWRLLGFGLVLIAVMILRPEGFIRDAPSMPIEERARRRAAARS